MVYKVCLILRDFIDFWNLPVKQASEIRPLEEVYVDMGVMCCDGVMIWDMACCDFDGNRDYNQGKFLCFMYITFCTVM